MSYIEHPNSWFPEFNIESGNGKYDVITEMVNSKKMCCETCDWFEIIETRIEDGFCLKNVANDKYGEYIDNSSTFYCSYHKFKDTI